LLVRHWIDSCFSLSLGMCSQCGASSYEPRFLRRVCTPPSLQDQSSPSMVEFRRPYASSLAQTFAAPLWRRVFFVSAPMNFRRPGLSPVVHGVNLDLLCLVCWQPSPSDPYVTVQTRTTVLRQRFLPLQKRYTHQPAQGSPSHGIMLLRRSVFWLLHSCGFT